MRDAYTRYPRPILWLIPGGTVELGGTDARASQEVVIEPFYISKLPLTNEQYEAYDPGYERLSTSPGDRDPAVGVSWRDAVGYCAWYAEVSRKPMRLPTEDEWEYACRGGQDGELFFAEGDADDHLWHSGNSGDRVPRLDDKKANPFGLWSMLGGVWEWTAAERLGQDRRVLRGGSFKTPREALVGSLRRLEAPTARFDDAGFRIAKSLR